MPAALKTRTVRVNKTFANIKDATERYVVSYGGRRSSKSTSHSQLHVRRGTQHKRHFLVMRKVARSLRMSC
jgi:phage terminase large subunit